MYDMPLWFLVGTTFIFGSIIGSFLDVFISRFHTGRSLNGRSHCTSCGHVLDWYELFPLLSYAVLRGRCLVCGARIPARLFWMEVVTGLLFVAAFLLTDDTYEFVFSIVFVVLALVITVYDIKHLVIPNVFVLLMLTVSLLQLGVWFYKHGDSDAIIAAIVSGVVAASFYFSLWLISKGRWIGKGDAKLALPLAILLTPLETFSFVVFSFWVGAGVSLVLLAVQWLLRRGQTHLRFLSIPLTMKSEVPFAPFLLLSFVLVYFFGLDVLRLFAIII